VACCDALDQIRVTLSEPFILHVQAGSVSVFQYVQVVVAGRHFPQQKVARRLKFALVKGNIGLNTLAQPLLRMHCLLQPMTM